jgi:hypothetical protein
MYVEAWRKSGYANMMMMITIMMMPDQGRKLEKSLDDRAIYELRTRME